MSLAAALLVGSSRVDQWRKEINALMSMVLGFLTDNECHILNMRGEILLAESTDHRWMVQYDPYKGLGFRLFRLRDGEEFEDNLVCELPKGRVPLDHVGFVHYCLDSFLAGMSKLFPALDGRWRALLGVARDEFRMYYELHFYVPSDDPRDGEDGKLVKFRKKSSLTFPLPIETEVFVHLEGEPSVYETLVLDGEVMLDGKKHPIDGTGSSFFKVIAHTHEMYDVHGDLSERCLIMMLEPEEGWEDIPAKVHFLHLLEVNGWGLQD